MLDLILQARSSVQTILIVVLFGLSLWRGGGPEKWCAATLLFMVVADRLYHAQYGPVGVIGLGLNLGHIAIDAVAMATLCRTALFANRLYPICLAALQFVALLAYPIHVLNPDLETGVVMILIVAPSYLQIPIFGLSFGIHLARQTKYGPYPSWRSY